MLLRCVGALGAAVVEALGVAVVAVLAAALLPFLLAGPLIGPASAAGVGPRPEPGGTSGSPLGAGGPAVTLASQSPYVAPGSPFDITVDLGPRLQHLAGGLQMKLTLYNRLTARSTFASTLSGTPVGGVLDTAGPVPVDGLSGTASMSATVENASSPATGPTILNLGCDPGSCSGVYPLEVTISGTVSGNVAGRLLTYLTYDEADLTAAGSAGGPGALRVAWVAPFAPRPPGDGGSQAQVAAALEGSVVPTTVLLYGQTVQELAGLASRHGRAGRTGRAALADLVELSTGGTDEVLAPPYAPIDAGALGQAGLTGEIELQVERGAALAAAQGIQTTEGIWLVQGGLGTGSTRAVGPLASAEGLPAGSIHLVVPDTDLAPPAGDPLTFSQPFSLQFDDGASVDAVAADSGLQAHFGAEPGDPVLAANQLLADLAFIHYERPSVAAPRGVVAAPPAGWAPSAAFVTTLLHGLSVNPVIEPVTLSTLFSTVPEGANGAQATRRPLSGGPGSVIPRAVVVRIAQERLRLSGFASAVASASPVTSSLNDGLLAAESDRLGTSGQLADVTGVERSLAAQLAQIQLATDRTITLTARNAPIPVTVLSSAPYPVRAVLTLSSDKFLFPTGARRMLTIDRSTNPLRIEAVARTSGDLPVAVTVTTPRFGLVIARGELTVRSTAVSLVGVVLTVAAAAVLLAWWARTWWRGRRARLSRTRAPAP